MVTRTIAAPEVSGQIGRPRSIVANMRGAVGPMDSLMDSSRVGLGLAAELPPPA